MEQGKTSKKILPCSLLAEGRRCVVVGGGKVAARKAGLLLDSGARVVVVSPDLGPRLAELVSGGSVVYVPRAFEPSDVDGAFVVFAATNDPAVNGQVREACRERGILCCRIDGAWTDGDFASPASIRTEGLTVSVATGGRSCRRSRLVKDDLARRVDLMGTSELLAVAARRNQLPPDTAAWLDARENGAKALGRMLRQIYGLHEFVLLVTRTRVEILGSASPARGTHDTILRILGLDRLPEGQYNTARGYEAFERAAVLATGLPPEESDGTETGAERLEEALATAREQSWAGSLMEEWVSCVLRIAEDRARGIAREHGDLYEQLVASFQGGTEG